MQRLTARRGRALVSLVTAAGLALAGAAVTTAPAQSAAPTGDCAVAFPVDELTAGDAVTGLTVTQGTTPEGFTGQVLGVLNDGVAPGIDMVMVRLSSPEIDRVGIWEGMSGSPVYAEDGRLIGAVAYGLAIGSSTVAGVTPYEAMDDYLGEPAARVAVGHATARRVARAADVSVARAEQGFDLLPMPTGVSGVGAARLAAAADRAQGHKWLPKSTYAVGRAGADAASADDIVAGGNLAASLSYGDITMGGVGTTTSVCGDRVVGFGHPLDWAGATTLAMHPADALYIQDDLVTGFKVANLGDPVGTITDDRLTGITGTLGALPDTADVSTSLTYGDRSRTGVSHVSLRTPDVLATTTFYSLIANHQVVVDGPVVGSEDVTWTIQGTDADGAPFTLSSDDLYTSRYDLTWDLGFGVGDWVYLVSRIPGVTVDSVSTEGTLRDDIASYKIAKLEVRQQGHWTKVDRRHEFVAHAGDLAARVTLNGGGATTVVPAHLTVPDRFSGRMVFLSAVGGSRFRFARPPHDLDALATWLDERVRNDEMVVSLSRGPRVHSGGKGGHAAVVGRKAGTPRTVQTVLGPFDGVVKGQAQALGFVR